MNEAIRQVALDYLKPPFKFNRGYIFDAEGHKVADDGDWKNHVVRIRGWGAISYLESPEQLQDMIGTLVAEALTEFWQRDTLRAQRDELLAPRYSIVEKDGTVICQCSDEGWAASIQELLDSNHLTVTKIVEGAAEPRTLRAALEYTNVLLAKLPPSDEITYRINANKAVLDETKD